MKNLSILLILVFGFLLSCTTDADIETNLESSEKIHDNDEFLEEISSNKVFLDFVEANKRIEQLITKTIEKNQLTPDDFRSLYKDQNEEVLKALFIDTDLIELSNRKRVAAKALFSSYPDLQNQVESTTSSNTKKDSQTVLFPFLDQSQLQQKCSSIAEWVLFQVCLALVGIVVTGCFINATVLMGPFGPYVCSLGGSAAGAKCYYDACIADKGNFYKDLKYLVHEV